MASASFCKGVSASRGQFGVREYLFLWFRANRYESILTCASLMAGKCLTMCDHAWKGGKDLVHAITVTWICLSFWAWFAHSPIIALFCPSLSFSAHHRPSPCAVLSGRFSAIYWCARGRSSLSGSLAINTSGECCATAGATCTIPRQDWDIYLSGGIQLN